MHQSRTRQLNDHGFNGTSVVYVMSRDQRIMDNHALLAAQATALEHKVPLYVLFILKTLPLRAREQYAFMLTGLEEVAASLARYNIGFVLRADSDSALADALRDVSAGAVYFDFSPLHGARTLARKTAESQPIPVSVVDTHNIIPAWTASDKQEFAAHTFRRKVHAHLEQFLVEPPGLIAHPHAPDNITNLSFEDAWKFVNALDANGTHTTATPGEHAALAHLRDFIDSGLEQYAIGRNDPVIDQQSNLSPYLHYGQVSSLRIALETIKYTDRRPLLFDEARMASVGDHPSSIDGMNALFEEMIVRKELSDNFCLYAPDYQSLAGVPNWAQQTLEAHRDDPREFVYSRKDWEAAATHDDAWNAAQTQLMRTGKLHGYMRMYWAKKMLEWSVSPEVALADCIYLNDTYSIDGRDPNGYVGILWSIAGLHDRPWTERSVFGAIRYMNAAGLKRKFAIQQYIDTWS